ncbi:uncharacterized protein DS421_4g120850 [Arachis hypogaea]|nr:uncharacterized protein DS421_4g120850 [Arachis hypogaea]
MKKYKEKSKRESSVTLRWFCPLRWFYSIELNYREDEEAVGPYTNPRGGLQRNPHT